VSGGQGLNWINVPEALRLDLPAWQKYFGFDIHGAAADIDLQFDADALTLTMTGPAAGKLPQVKTGVHFARALRGDSAGATRAAGPLRALPAASAAMDVDPRKH